MQVSWPCALGFVGSLGGFACTTATPPVAAHDDAAAASLAPTALPVAASADAAADPRPAEPPYDLAADIQARIADAEPDGGASIPVRVESRTFVFLSPDRGARFDATVDLARDALAAYFHGRFDKHPRCAISILVYSSTAAYEAGCKTRLASKCETPFGFYRAGTRTIFMNAEPGISTVTHEIVHPIMETDFPLAPRWLNEGIGSLFEKPVRGPPGEIHGATNWRLATLKAALGSVHVEALFGMSDDEFSGTREGLHYAMARYLCQWLDEKDLLWKVYRAWRDSVRDDPSGEKAFAAIVGETPAQANAEWVKWVKALQIGPR
jgi:hypothetical protein